MPKEEKNSRPSPPLKDEIYIPVEVDYADLDKIIQEVGGADMLPAKINIHAWVDRLEVIRNMEVDMLVSFAKRNFDDDAVIGAFTYAYPMDDILAEVPDSDIIEEVADRCLEDDIITDKSTIVTKALNLEEVELQEVFAEACRRCRPRDLINLLESAR